MSEGNVSPSLTFQPATVARLTAAGRGAVAVLRVCGETEAVAPAFSTCFQPANRKAWSAQPVGRLLYGRWGTTAAEDLVICRTDATTTEIQCHGGDAAVSRIVHDLQQWAVQPIAAEDQLLNSVDLWTRDLQQALTKSLTLRTADLIHQQLCGVWQQAVEQLTAKSGDPQSNERRRRFAADILAWKTFGRHLTRPWSVVLTGRPNVGKSSLINALLGYQRAIVSETPGTTRDVVSGVTAFDGWPVQLSDTAGIRDTAESLEAAGIERATRQLASADLVLVVLDLSEPLTAADEACLQRWPEGLRIAQKSDQQGCWRPDEIDAIPVSAVTGAGLPELQAKLVQMLIPDTPPPDTPLPVTVRQRDWLASIATTPD